MMTQRIQLPSLSEYRQCLKCPTCQKLRCTEDKHFATREMLRTIEGIRPSPGLKPYSSSLPDTPNLTKSPQRNPKKQSQPSPFTKSPSKPYISLVNSPRPPVNKVMLKPIDMSKIRNIKEHEIIETYTKLGLKSSKGHLSSAELLPISPPKLNITTPKRPSKSLRTRHRVNKSSKDGTVEFQYHSIMEEIKSLRDLIKGEEAFIGGVNAAPQGEVTERSHAADFSLTERRARPLVKIVEKELSE